MKQSRLKKLSKVLLSVLSGALIATGLGSADNIAKANGYVTVESTGQPMSAVGPGKAYDDYGNVVGLDYSNELNSHGWNTPDNKVIKVDGEIAFCVEPWSQVASGVYYGSGTNFYNTISTAVMLAKAREIANKAYWGFYNQYGDVSFNLVSAKQAYVYTQAWIWESFGWTIVGDAGINLNNYGVTFTNDLISYGLPRGQAAYDEFKRQAQNRMDNGDLVPNQNSVPRNDIFRAGETKTYTDTNGVLSSILTAGGYTAGRSYTLDGGFTIRHNGANTLTVTAPNTTGVTSRLSATNSTNANVPLIYKHSNGQDVATLNIGHTSSFLAIYRVNQPVERENVIINIVKKETGTTTPIQGATFEIANDLYFNQIIARDTTNSSGIVSFSGTDYRDLRNVPAGKRFYYREVSVPSPYVLDRIVRIITVNETTPTVIKTLQVKNDRRPTPVKFSKRDLGGQELRGATIQVINRDNNSVVETWVSDGTVKTFNLQPGRYKFKETVAPNGYTIASDIEFTVEPNGTIKKGSETVSGNAPIVMVDNYATHNIKIKKVDKSTRGMLAGANFHIYRANNQNTVTPNDSPVQSWTSTTQEKTVSLQPGKYVLREVTAPTGYIKAVDKLIEISVDGTLKVDGKVHDKTIAIEFENKRPEFPKTGGFGTLIYIVGGVLVLAVGIYGYRRKFNK